MITLRRRRLPIALAAALVGMCASTMHHTLVATATPTSVDDVGRPNLYGWVTEFIGWRGAMATTVPLVILAWILTATSMPLRPRPPHWWRLTLRDIAQPVNNHTLAGLTLAIPGDAPSLILAASAVGFGCGTALPILPTRIQAAADPQRMASASSLGQLARHGGAAAIVPVAGIWPAQLVANHAAAALLATFALVAVSGLVISWRIS